MFDWSKIETVLLDMDGTILDLHFDTFFWMEHLPLRYSEHYDVPIAQAREALISDYESVVGTISWYCLDYWAEKTKMPIRELKREVEHLIQLREDAHDFLVALRQAGKDVVLVTNAHPDALSLKIERTQLDQYFDTLYSTHEFGVTKESQELWHKLQHKHGFDKATTLFVDDNIPVLNSAKQYGIGHILAVANPDSKQGVNDMGDYLSITDYRTIVGDIV
ncbi:GMP/IMP nucleotidase [Thalassotalea agarivorans]|uniref:Putative hydrolase of the HAD superfamily n=1 Tax=Thalassotalea agarivorans TaxID=349064 RepID=A0A1I0CW57_THASX|nr:GMP/IMP nucleotidase [Thalassotalea agarivorans]SET23356.1 putative hydrolase of the HAD superfamily [Thalassotalea agarivorans]